MKKKTRRAGFTLIEVLVVVAIIAMLIALLLPAIGMVRARYRASECQSNMRQIWLANVAARKNHQQNIRRLPAQARAAALARFRVENLKETLAPFLENQDDVWICPAAPLENGFGFNERIARLDTQDAGRIALLDYKKIDALVVGQPIVDPWEETVAPRHFGSVNIVNGGGSAAVLDPRDIDPQICENQIKYWISHIDAEKHDLDDMNCDRAW